VQRPPSMRSSRTWASATSSERWIRTKPGRAHSSSSAAAGPHQVRAVGGVQPRVVALRLDVGDRRSG
jgi:hypothetical protein